MAYRIAMGILPSETQRLTRQLMAAGHALSARGATGAVAIAQNQTAVEVRKDVHAAAERQGYSPLARRPIRSQFVGPAHPVAEVYIEREGLQAFWRYSIYGGRVNPDADDGTAGIREGVNILGRRRRYRVIPFFDSPSGSFRAYRSRFRREALSGKGIGKQLRLRPAEWPETNRTTQNIGEAIPIGKTLKGTPRRARVQGVAVRSAKYRPTFDFFEIAFRSSRKNYKRFMNAALVRQLERVARRERAGIARRARGGGGQLGLGL